MISLVPQLLVVDREERTLDIFKYSLRNRRYTKRQTFDVTVGKIGHETPHGLYFVENKSRTPDWRMPEDPDYPEEKWGTIYKFGEPGNPFAGGFISLHGEEPGIGLHGTVFDPMVGTASSHGCIRMRTEDLLKIYDSVTVNTPVYLH